MANQCALTYLSATERLRLVKILAQSSLNNDEEKAVVVLFSTVNGRNTEQAILFYDGLLSQSNNVNGVSLFKTLYDGIQDIYNNNFTDWIKAISRKINNDASLVSYFTANYITTESSFDNILIYSNDSWISRDEVGKNTYDVVFENNGNVKITRHVVESLTESTQSFTDEFGVTEQITTYTPVWNTYPELTYGPFDLVTLINNSELASLQEVTGGDQFCVLPAIFFKFAKDKQFNDNAIQATALTFDAITIFTGPGNVVKAYKAGRIAIALLEGSMVLGSAGNIVANSLPNGSVAKEYITRYNLVISILGAGRSVITGGSKLKSLTQNAWNGSLNYPGLKLADVDYLINNFETAKNILKSNLNVAQFSSLKRVKNYLAKIRKGGNNIDNLAGGAGSLFKVGDDIAGVTVKQLRKGPSSKIVIIGRQMRDHVYKVAEALQLEGKYVEVLDDIYLQTMYDTGFEFIIEGKKWTVNSAWDDMAKNPAWDIYRDANGFIKVEHLYKVPMYKLNKMWIEKAGLEGATILDIGYPIGHDMSISGFYEMERTTIIWD